MMFHHLYSRRSPTTGILQGKLKKLLDDVSTVSNAQESCHQPSRSPRVRYRVRPHCCIGDCPKRDLQEREDYMNRTVSELISGRWQSCMAAI
jgi:hypothetical protein